MKIWGVATSTKRHFEILCMRAFMMHEYCQKKKKNKSYKQFDTFNKGILNDFFLQIRRVLSPGNWTNVSSVFSKRTVQCSNPLISRNDTVIVRDSTDSQWLYIVRSVGYLPVVRHVTSHNYLIFSANLGFIASAVSAFVQSCYSISNMRTLDE